MTTSLTFALISLGLMTATALLSGAATLGIANHIGDFWLYQQPNGR